MTKRSVATDVAKEQDKQPKNDVVTLSTGVRARIVPVASSLIDEINLLHSDPIIPSQEIDGQMHENPLHPEYRQAMKEASAERTTAILDAFVLFGIELIDGVPDDGVWEKKIKFMEKRGALDLSVYDLEDEFDREFVFKRYIACASRDTRKVAVASGILAEEIERAIDSFRGDETRTSDSESVDQE